MDRAIHNKNAVFGARRRRRGFSMAEALIVIGILAILGALGVPALFRTQRSMRQTELDGKAELVYTSVQNQLVKLRSAGVQDLKAEQEANKFEKSFFETDEGNTLWYITAANSAAVLPDLTMDDTLRNANWVVELRPADYSVNAVFYSETDSFADYSSGDKRYNDLRYKDQRLESGARVGYYSGGETATSQGILGLQPEMVIVNGETLEAQISVVIPKKLASGESIRLEFEIEDAQGHTAAFNETHSFNSTSLKRNSATGKWELKTAVVLDDLTKTGSGFTEKFPGLVPGPITVKMKARHSNTALYDPPHSWTVCTDNSSFGYDAEQNDGAVALISNLRHLQNLNVLQNSSVTVTKALLTEDIRFSASDNSDTAKVLAAQFAPLQIAPEGGGTALRELDGQNHVISGLRVKTGDEGGAAGLFGELRPGTEGLTLRNLRFTGTRAEAENGWAGAVAGTLGNTGPLKVESCQILLTDSDFDSVPSDQDKKTWPWISGRYAGGLVGGVAAGGALTVENSLASSIVEGSVGGGGLVGHMLGSSAAISHSYTSGYTYGARTGALVGPSEAGEVTLTASYAAGFQAARGTDCSAAGLVNGAVAQATNCYTISSMQVDKDGTIYTTAPSITTVLGGVLYGTVDNGEADIHYVSAEGTDAIGGRSTEDMVKNDLSPDFVTGHENSSPYKKLELGLTSYTYPRLKKNGTGSEPMWHYGVWDAPFQVGALVYYEEYEKTGDLGEVEKVYGFYGANVEDSLREDLPVTGDGYGLVYRKEDLPVNKQGEPDIEHYPHFYYQTNRLITPISPIAPETYPKYAYTVENPQWDPEHWETWAEGENESAGTAAQNTDNYLLWNIIPVDEDHLPYSLDVETEDGTTTYYIIPLPAKVMNAKAPGSDNSFYRQIAVKAEVELSENHISRKLDTFAFNPYFAQTNILSTQQTTPQDSEILLRTPRQLYSLSLYHDQFSGFLSGCTVSQERDIDYAPYDWDGYFRGEKTELGDVEEQSPIGNFRHAFTGKYDGHCYRISGISFAVREPPKSRGEWEYVGLFGNVDQRARLENIVLFNGELRDNIRYAHHAGGEDMNTNIYIGALAGCNSGFIFNCAVAGYTLAETAEANGVLSAANYVNIYAGGLVGYNDKFGIIRNCSADCPSLQLSSLNSQVYLGAFAGENAGSVQNCYALGHIEAVDVEGGVVKVSGFAGFTRAAIENCYCAVSIISAGTAEPYPFAFAAGDSNTVVRCRYLSSGTYAYPAPASLAPEDKDLSHLYSYTREDADKPGIPVDRSALLARQQAAAYAYTGSLVEYYPYTAVVTNRSGLPIHYGSWQEYVDLGNLGVFYWEHEVEGNNSGYHLTFVGVRNNTTFGGTTLCNAHDDGGRVAEYGYGYFVKGDPNASEPTNLKYTMEGMDCSGGVRHETAAAALSGGINGAVQTGLNVELNNYVFYPFTSRMPDEAENSAGADKSYICLKPETDDQTLTKARSGFWNLEYGNYIYRFELGVFFGNALRLDSAVNLSGAGVYVGSYSLGGPYLNVTGADGRTSDYRKIPGGNDNPYEVRSVEQLRYINWCTKPGAAATGTLVKEDNYLYFPYLQYAEKFGEKKTQDLDIIEQNRPRQYWRQTHDIRGTDGVAFTPIAGMAESTGDNNAIDLRAWFGGEYDGESYKIQNVPIQSDSFTVGLFGVATGATMKNIILYSDEDTAIERDTTIPGGQVGTAQGSYCIGGLAGTAYDASDKPSNEISNCAIAGYRIIDHSTNKQGAGKANVGGLIGISKVNLSRCSAVTDILIDCTHPNSYPSAGNYLRVGGLVGSTRLLITDCYTGGSIQVSDRTRSELPGDGRNRDKTFHIYAAGISGGVYCVNYHNITGQSGSQYQDGLFPKIIGCYTYTALPAMGGTVRGVSLIGSVADRHSLYYPLEIHDCYCLDSVLDSLDPQAYFALPLYDTTKTNSYKNNPDTLLTDYPDGYLLEYSAGRLQQADPKQYIRAEYAGDPEEWIRRFWTTVNGDPILSHYLIFAQYPQAAHLNNAKNPKSPTYDPYYDPTYGPEYYTNETGNFWYNLRYFYNGERITWEDSDALDPNTHGPIRSVTYDELRRVLTDATKTDSEGRQEQSYVAMPDRLAGNRTAAETGWKVSDSEGSWVTTTSPGGAIPGKYSFGSRPELEGMDYPFPTVVTQRDLSYSRTVNVHYGPWPNFGPFWAEGMAEMDLFADMKDCGEAGDANGGWWAEKIFNLTVPARANPPENPAKTDYDYVSGAKDENGEDYVTLTALDPVRNSDGSVTYPVLVRALREGTTRILAYPSGSEETAAHFTLSITAQLSAGVTPAEVRGYPDERGAIELRAWPALAGEDGQTLTLPAALPWPRVTDGEGNVTPRTYYWEVVSEKVGWGDNPADDPSAPEWDAGSQSWLWRNASLELPSSGTDVAELVYTCSYNNVNYSVSCFVSLRTRGILGLSARRDLTGETNPQQYAEAQRSLAGGTVTGSAPEPAYAEGAGPNLPEAAGWADFFLYAPVQDEDLRTSVTLSAYTVTGSAGEDLTGNYTVELEDSGAALYEDGSNQYRRGALRYTGDGSSPEGVTLTLTLRHASDGETVYALPLRLLHPVRRLVTFLANGGNESPFPVPIWTEGDVEAIVNDPTRTGYTFRGWSTDPDAAPDDPSLLLADPEGHVLSISAGAGGDVSYYAIWAPNSYTVSFDPNGGTGEMEPMTFTYDDAAQTLPECAFTSPVPGQEFAGWGTEETGGTIYQPGAAAPNISNTEGAACTLYAQWRTGTVLAFHFADRIEYVSVVPNAGVRLEGDFRAESPEKGQVFDGWYSAETGGELVVTVDGVMQMAYYQQHLYPHYHEATLTLWYMTGEPEQLQSVSYRASEVRSKVFLRQPEQYFENVPQTTRSLLGHTYAIDGWFTENEGDGGTMVLTSTGKVVWNNAPYADSDGNLTLTDDLSLYARWSREAAIRNVDPGHALTPNGTGWELASPLDIDWDTEYLEVSMNTLGPNTGWRRAFSVYVPGYPVKGNESNERPKLFMGMSDSRENNHPKFLQFNMFYKDTLPGSDQGRAGWRIFFNISENGLSSSDFWPHNGLVTVRIGKLYLMDPEGSRDENRLITVNGLSAYDFMGDDNARARWNHVFYGDGEVPGSAAGFFESPSLTVGWPEEAAKADGQDIIIRIGKLDGTYLFNTLT